MNCACVSWWQLKHVDQKISQSDSFHGALKRSLSAQPFMSLFPAIQAELDFIDIEPLDVIRSIKVPLVNNTRRSFRGETCSRTV
jgi:hypothetical protein